MRILIVEDNRKLSASLAASLAEEGYAVDAAHEGPEGEYAALSSAYDLVILDVMLPGKDGFSVCRSLRSRRMAAPILMLTARDGLEDRVKGLDGGADDYLPKPFELAELKARIRALLRRVSPEKGGELRAADLTLDPASHRVFRAGRELSLTAREFALLEYFLRNRGRLVTREMAEAHLWSQEELVASNVVDVYVRRLRAKVDEGFAPALIETVRGAGYRLGGEEEGE